MGICPAKPHLQVHRKRPCQQVSILCVSFWCEPTIPSMGMECCSTVKLQPFMAGGSGGTHHKHNVCHWPQLSHKALAMSIVTQHSDSTLLQAASINIPANLLRSYGTWYRQPQVSIHGSSVDLVTKFTSDMAHLCMHRLSS